MREERKGRLTAKTDDADQSQGWKRVRTLPPLPLTERTPNTQYRFSALYFC